MAVLCGDVLRFWLPASSWAYAGLDGTKLVVDTAADIRWQWIFIGTAVVFFQLLRQMFQKAVKHLRTEVYSAGDRWLYR